jgi:hypothetical protein
MAEQVATTNFALISPLRREKVAPSSQLAGLGAGEWVARVLEQAACPRHVLGSAGPAARASADLAAQIGPVRGAHSGVQQVEEPRVALQAPEARPGVALAVRHALREGPSAEQSGGAGDGGGVVGEATGGVVGEAVGGPGPGATRMLDGEGVGNSVKVGSCVGSEQETGPQVPSSWQLASAIRSSWQAPHSGHACVSPHS